MCGPVLHIKLHQKLRVRRPENRECFGLHKHFSPINLLNVKVLVKWQFHTVAIEPDTAPDYVADQEHDREDSSETH